MYSFKEFLTKDNFILSLADQYFNLTLDEAPDIAITYYEKDPQVIMISQHGLEDGKRKGRLWWDDENHLKDPKFTDFADKCLSNLLGPLEDYIYDYVDSFTKEKKSDKIHTNKAEKDEIGFCDKNRQKGWVVRLNKSKDDNVTSCTIITVLYMPVMNKNAPLFVNPKTYVVNLDKRTETINDNHRSVYKTIDAEIKKLTDEYEIAYIEADDMPDGKEKSIKMKDANKKLVQIQNLKNRKENLKSSLSITESVIVTDKVSNKKVRFIMV